MCVCSGDRIIGLTRDLQWYLCVCVRLCVVLRLVFACRVRSFVGRRPEPPRALGVWCVVLQRAIRMESVKKIIEKQYDPPLCMCAIRVCVLCV